MKRNYADFLGECKFKLSLHAAERMEERNITDEDVRLVYLFGERQPQMGETDALYYMSPLRLKRLQRHLNLPSSLVNLNVVVHQRRCGRATIKTVYRAEITAKRKKDNF
tara:strand:- start:70 stop:396 length:327 start_codon:yes stop_codon:yes gene_type:complete